MTKEEKENFDKLCIEYGYQELVGENLETYTGEWYEFSPKSISEYSRFLADAAKLMQILESCADSTIELSGTITHPDKGERKTEKKKIVLESYDMRNLLYTVSQGLLNEAYREFEQPEKVGVEADKLEECDYLPLETDINNKASTILDVSKRVESLTTVPKNVRLGGLFYDLYNGLLCGTYQRDENDVIKTKDYSFVYDCLALIGQVNSLGDGYSGLIGKEKYTFVRNCLNAHKKSNSETN